MNRMDGMNYAPQGRPKPAVKPGEFVFSAAHIDHGHIYGMCNGLTEAGGTLKYVYDPDPKKVEAFVKAYPQAKAAASLDEILEDRQTRMVCSSNVTSERGPLGVKVMRAGKDYFVDKAPFTTLGQLEDAKATVAQTGRKYMVYYSERLHVEGAILAGYMIDAGEIGRVLSVTGFGPHRLGAAGRPRWFFEREKYGGILCDIGSHQIEQYLHFAGEEDATVQSSRIANYAHPEYPELVAQIRSEEYYVNMMKAWYFATALAKQYEAVLPFIEGRRLDDWTHRKAIQKSVESYRITQEQKQYLKSLK